MTTSWKVHSVKQNDISNNPRDFKKLNKKAVLTGMVTAKDNYKFRQSHDSRIPFGLEALKNKDLQLPPLAFSYGKPNKPSTPLKGIILNDYGETAGYNLQQKYKAI